MQPRRRDRGGVERGVDLARQRDRLVGVLRARLDEDAMHRRVMARPARPCPRSRPGRSRRAPRRRARSRRPASIPIPRSASSAASSRQPSSERFSETRSGRSVHSEIARGAGVDVAARDPEPGRERDLDARRGRAQRATAAAMSAGSSVSWPSASRGWACSETRAGGDARRAPSAASSAGVSGTPASRSPFRQAWRTMPPGRTPRRAAPRRSGTSSACRPAGSAPARRRSCRRARRP